MLNFMFLEMMDARPVQHIEYQKCKRKNYSALFLHIFTGLLFLDGFQINHQYEFKHEEAYIKETYNHPDIQEGDVADLRNCVSDPTEHCCQGQDGCHPYGNSAWDGFRRNVERQVTCRR